MNLVTVEISHLAHIVGLMCESKLHRRFTSTDITGLIVPPLLCGQNRGLVSDDDRLVAWMSWAYMDDERAEKFLKREIKLSLGDWHCGNRIVCMDWIAPFGHTYRLFKEVRGLARGEEISWVRIPKGNRIAKVMNNG